VINALQLPDGINESRSRDVLEVVLQGHVEVKGVPSVPEADANEGASPWSSTEIKVIHD